MELVWAQSNLGLQNVGWRNVSEANGIAIALTGMLIVFVALVLISVFISTLPRLMALVEPHLPAAEPLVRVADQPAKKELAAPPAATGLDESLVAAIGAALHARRSDS